MTALVFKFPVDRPPFFGIKFDNEQEAKMTNKFAPRLRDGWMAKIEVESIRIHITLIRNVGTIHSTHKYTVYEWSKNDLIKFLNSCKRHQVVTFGHVAKISEEVKVVHWVDIGFAWWIRINKIEFNRF